MQLKRELHSALYTVQQIANVVTYKVQPSGLFMC